MDGEYYLNIGWVLMNFSNEPLTLKAGGLAFFTSILWGGMFVSIKLALVGMPPIALAGTRFMIGGLTVLLWATITSIPIYMRSADRRSLSLLATLFTLQILALYEGANFTLASRSTVLVCTFPFFTAIFAHRFIPGDRLNSLKVLGIVLSFIGVFALFVENFILKEFGYFIGDVLSLSSGFFLGVRQVYSKHLVQRMHPYKILLWQSTLSFPILFLLSLLTEKVSYRFTPIIISAILYQGMVVAGFCFIVQTTLLRRYSASNLSVFGFFTPVFGVLLSNLILGEGLTLTILMSMILVGTGIGIVNFRR